MANPNPLLEGLRGQVAAVRTVNASATTLINGIAARIKAAVDKAAANGATAEELAPLTAEVALLTAGSADLSAAVVANTDADDAPPPVEPTAGRR